MKTVGEVTDRNGMEVDMNRVKIPYGNGNGLVSVSVAEMLNLSKATRGQGMCEFYNKERGFGKIICGEKKIFFHASKLKSNVEEGDWVCFQPKKNDRGEIAEDVERVINHEWKVVRTDNI